MDSCPSRNLLTFLTSVWVVDDDLTLFRAIFDYLLVMHSATVVIAKKGHENTETGWIFATPIVVSVLTISQRTTVEIFLCLQWIDCRGKMTYFVY